MWLYQAQNRIGYAVQYRTAHPALALRTKFPRIHTLNHKCNTLKSFSVRDDTGRLSVSCTPCSGLSPMRFSTQWLVVAIGTILLPDGLFIKSAISLVSGQPSVFPDDKFARKV